MNFSPSNHMCLNQHRSRWSFFRVCQYQLGCVAIKKKSFRPVLVNERKKLLVKTQNLIFFFFSLLCRSECYEDLTSSHCARHSEGSTLAWNSNSSPLLFFRFSSIDNNKTVMKIECRFNFHFWKCVCSESRRRSRANYELTILFTRLITVHLHRENSSREREGATLTKLCSLRHHIIVPRLATSPRALLIQRW